MIVDTQKKQTYIHTLVQYSFFSFHSTLTMAVSYFFLFHDQVVRKQDVYIVKQKREDIDIQQTRLLTYPFIHKRTKEREREKSTALSFAFIFLIYLLQILNVVMLSVCCMLLLPMLIV